MKVIVTAAARARIECEIASAGKQETGGVLLGWRRPDLDVAVVADATGPGAGAVRTRTRLELDTADLQVQVDAAFEATNGDHAFLGDWHLHHEAKPRPSQRDMTSLSELVSETGLAMPEGVLVIVGRSRRAQLTWRAWSAAEWREAEIGFADA